MKGRIVFLWAALAVVAAPAFSAPGVYKWVDTEGQVHYGERPPGDGPASEVKLKDSAPPPAPDSQTNPNENTQRLLRAMQEERAKKQELSDKAAKEKELNKRNCNEARDQLRNLQEAGRIYKLDPNGERRYLNDAEHTAELQRANQDVKKYCK